jgi:inner membrane protein YidH
VDEPGVEDATRRTRLANERTYLAWQRTGLTALAVCVAIGRLVPELTDATRWPYELVGVGYGILGLGFVAFGYVRSRQVQRALDRGLYEPLSETMSIGLVALGVVLAIATILLVVFSD